MAGNKQDIANRLIEIRTESGLLSKEFAAKAGIDPKNYSSIENAKRTIGDRVIMDICKAFNVNVNWIKTGEGEKYKKSKSEDEVSMPREVFDQLSKLTETVLSQQRTIENLAEKRAAGGAGVARKTAAG